jgi:hypothetical protein
MITNESLQHRTCRCHPDALGAGAVSFKRVLGSVRKEGSYSEGGSSRRTRVAMNRKLS